MKMKKKTDQKIFRAILSRVIHISPRFCAASLLLALLFVAEKLSGLLFPTLLLEEMTGALRMDRILLWGCLCILAPAFFSAVSALLSAALENLAGYVEDELEASIDSVNMQVSYEDFDAPEIHAAFQEIKDGQNMVGPVTGVLRSHGLSITRHVLTLVLYFPLMMSLIATDTASSLGGQGAAWI